MDKELIVSVFEVIHFLGLAALIGGLFSQWKDKEKQVTRPMLIGTWTQLITGLIMVGFKEPDVNHLKITIKFAFLLVIGGILLAHKKKALPSRLYSSILCIGVLEVAIAVLWT
ncbi:MAG: hypothetical protein WCP97_03895 [bacterium]